jgi:chromosomal replication initiation ATPase DnaA
VRDVARQLSLDLGHRAAYGRDDFLVTPSNAPAVALVDQWPNWPSHAAVIVGAGGSGKTHLAQVWQNRSAAFVVENEQFVADDVPQILAGRAAIVEDMHRKLFDERAVFHLLNHARQTNGTVLFTSAQWRLQDVALPDLKSRLGALPVAHILPPDDALLRGVLVKQFNDRQIAVDEALVSFLLTRMPRSLDVARQLVARIDAEAMEQGASITRAFASKVLLQFENPELL